MMADPKVNVPTDILEQRMYQLQEQYPTPNRKERRAQKARMRPQLKKMGAGRKEVEALFKQMNIDPSKIQTVSAEELRQMKGNTI